MKISCAVVSFVAFLASSSVKAANPTECVTDFDANTDYFPDKVVVESSEHWSITYENSYKIVRNDAAGTSYLLYQCGTPPPQDAGQHDAVVPVPLGDFGVHYTSFIAYVELLGLRSSITAVGGQAAWIYSPCLNKMIDQDMVDVVSDINNATIVADVGVSQDVPFFVGSSSHVFDDGFEVTEWMETNQLATFEWIKFFSVFFNREKEANMLFDAAMDRTECAKNNAGILSADKEKPVILWGYYSGCGGWDVAQSCPNYYCELADTCGATLLTSMEGSVDAQETCFRNYMTTEEFVAFGKDADIWIYPGRDLDTILSQYSDDLKDFVSVKNNKVYDVAGQTFDAWSAERKTEPDTLIQDFCSVVGNENPSTPTPHQLTFLRHVDDAVASPAVCTDATAPLQKLGSECVPVVVNQGGNDESSASAAKTMAAFILAAAATLL